MHPTNALSFENQLWNQNYCRIAGIDEAGRGPLAGPVVAAAVVFEPGQQFIDGIDDSKKMSRTRREEILHVINYHALAVGIGIVGEFVIDRINILQATFVAMQEAINDLSETPDYLLFDGHKQPQVYQPATCIIKGDSKSMSIAAASIVAKVTRDQLMMQYDREYPLYGFAQHKGYPTRKHVEAIRRHGLCPIHRRSFRPRSIEHLYES
ncbi:ribonuclease HII [candidate division KSB1 bacterium]|nr:ribonuclease HII [candidate division KSB1 bacterium]